jgi:hypothetical protein
MRCQVPLGPDLIVNRVPESAVVNVPSGSFPGRRNDRAMLECEYPATSFG